MDAPTKIDNHVVLFFDDNGGLDEVIYNNHKPLTPEQLGAVLANLIRDTMGDEPEITDVIAIQAAMSNAMNPEK
jgi:hypothetical protein